MAGACYVGCRERLKGGGERAVQIVRAARVGVVRLAEVNGGGGGCLLVAATVLIERSVGELAQIVLGLLESAGEEAGHGRRRGATATAAARFKILLLQHYPFLVERTVLYVEFSFIYLVKWKSTRSTQTEQRAVKPRIFSLPSWTKSLEISHL